MSPIQRVIKYCAMGFAIALIIGILTGVTAIVSGIDQGINWDGDVSYTNFTDKFNNVKNLDITNYSGKMIIQTGNVTEVIVKATNVPDTTIVKMKDDGTLYIDQHNHEFNLFGIYLWGHDDDDDSQINIILPIDFTAESVQLDNNSGRMELSGLYMDDLDISGGSGDIIGSNLNAKKFDISANSGSLELDDVVLNDGDLDGGSGDIQITNAAMNDLSMSIESGSVRFEGSLTGEIDVDGGSGDATFNLNNTLDNYDISIDSGSGRVTINGESIDEEHFKNKGAENEMNIDGGSGDISINFTE